MPAKDPHGPTALSRAARKRRRRIRTRRLVATAAIAVIGVGGTVGIGRFVIGSRLTPMRARIVETAEGQLGYRTDPAHSYCNRFSAHFGVGTPTECANGLRSEEWCADFAAWVWQQAGAVVSYDTGPTSLSSASYSFYRWGVAHGTWHPLHSTYQPVPGDVAVYGLDVTTASAVHVGVVTAVTHKDHGPDVVNGDGDRSGFSVVETGTDQLRADTHGNGAPLAGYVAPSPPGPVTPTKS